MWKEPKFHSIDAPSDIKELISKSVYWNSEGNLSGSPKMLIVGYILIVIIIESLLFYFLIIVSKSLPNYITIQQVIIIFIFIFTLTMSFYYFYQWGWKNYKEAWYFFDSQNEMFIVTRQLGKGWETIDVPYEEIDRIEYVDGRNGKAIIRSAGFRFETNRALDKRESSVTELWGNLAGTSANMINWPIKLICEKCNRIYGHHIGTALCPFCSIILIDPKIKGRIDPISLHPDDLDRI